MARFFIDRPIFAWVIAIVIMVAGVLSIIGLPISQYPSIAPPAITINAAYPGASAKTLEDTVTQVIEQKLSGIDNLRYMESTSDSAGIVTITLTFNNGTNPDTAQVQVQNKLSLAMPLLPQEVQQQGVSVNKSVRNFLLVVGFISTDGSLNTNDLGDFIVGSIQDPLSRVPGVGDIQVFGTQYAMRIWLDPNKLNSFKLTTAEVSDAIKAQNAQVSAGQLGGLPAVDAQLLNATIVAQTRLQTADQFANILLRVNPDGSRVLLKDVARVELGGENYTRDARFSGQPAVGMAIRPATGSNALETVAAIRARVAQLAPFFPPSVKVVYPLDTTPFVRLSIEEVIKTLVEAVVLVFLVMYLFLQNFRATLIPTIAVPVVLLGTFAVISIAGFSINTLTLFGVVLAIGLLVDDAIVVVENVERIMSEEGCSPLDRRDLPPVLHHDCLRYGVVRARRARAHSGFVRYHPEAHRQGSPCLGSRFLRLVQQDFRSQRRPLRFRRRSPHPWQQALDARLRDHPRRARRALHPHALRLSPRRRPRHHVCAGPTSHRFHLGSVAGGS
jgi:hydrophobe/amphiphile efflux-1 (HAE1) family protein